MRKEPVPGEARHWRPASIPDRETADQDERSNLEESEYGLGRCARGDSKGDKRQYRQHQDCANGGDPKSVVALMRRNKIKRRFAGRERRRHFEYC
jgi:hypothetical protein